MKALPFVSALALLVLVACTSTAPSSTADAGDETPFPKPDSETPPTSTEAAMREWIAQGTYPAWACEKNVGGPDPGSPHRWSRGCNNAKLAKHKSNDEYPVGASAVRDLYDDAKMAVTGHVVGLHVRAGKTADTWFWYEEKAGVVTVHGLGTKGLPASEKCDSCHTAAGSGYEGHDYIFRPVVP